MSHFAKVENGIVTDVIGAEQDFIDSGVVGDPSIWVQTSYNTHGGVHRDPNTWEPDGGLALRKNYAGIGYTYDPVRDAFIPPKPHTAWVLDEDTCLWEAPIPYPDETKLYFWSDETNNWELAPGEE